MKRRFLLLIESGLFWIFFGIVPSINVAISAETPNGQTEWDQIVRAARNEKELTIYGNVGYESIFAEFGKKYPDFKLSYVTGRGSADIVPRVLSEQRAGKYLGDIFLAGPNATFVIHQAKGLEPLKPALILPEVVDPSKWWQGKHQYVDKEGAYVFTFNGTFRVDVVYNSNLVNPKELNSYWDLINPKWKGKVVAFTQITAPHKFFYYQPELGPKFLNQLFGQMDVATSHDIRQIADWLGVGKFGIGIFTSPGNRNVGKAREQGLPIGIFRPDHFKEGVALLTAAGAGGLLKQSPHPNAAKLAFNWLLSREGQIAFQNNYARETRAADSFRIDIPKDQIPLEFRRTEGVKYLDVDNVEYIDAKPVRNFYGKLWGTRAK
jgi:ABC-type Fe3+ transport system substrate-binding protein